MNPKILQFIMAASGIGSFFPQPTKRTIRVVDLPAFTTNEFGPTEEIAGKTLEVLSCNPEGDCLCLFSGRRGTNIVDVDHRDISQNIK
jgi:hypothetical protein